MALIRHFGFVAFALPRRRDPCTLLAVRRELTVKAGQIDAGLGHQCLQSGDEVQRLEQHRGGPVVIGCFQFIANFPIGRERQPFFRQRLTTADAIVPKRLSTLHPCRAM